MFLHICTAVFIFLPLHFDVKNPCLYLTNICCFFVWLFVTWPVPDGGHFLLLLHTYCSKQTWGFLLVGWLFSFGGYICEGAPQSGLLGQRVSLFNCPWRWRFTLLRGMLGSYFSQPSRASGAGQASPLPLNCLPNPSLDLFFMFVCLFD